jgi:uncharacterized membrane protein YjdF
MKTGVYDVWPWFDSVMHFSGGIAIAMMAYAAWDMRLGLYEQRVMDSIPVLIKVIAVIGFVSFIGIVWEWHEFLRDYIRLQELISFVPAQPSIADTMKDLFLDILGAALYVTGMTFFFKRKN